MKLKLKFENSLRCCVSLSVHSLTLKATVSICNLTVLQFTANFIAYHMVYNPITYLTFTLHTKELYVCDARCVVLISGKIFISSIFVDVRSKEFSPKLQRYPCPWPCQKILFKSKSRPSHHTKLYNLHASANQNEMEAHCRSKCGKVVVWEKIVTTFDERHISVSR